MDSNANSGANGAADTSSVTAIKVQVVLDTTTEQLKRQFSGIQTDIEKDPIGLTFGVDKKTSKDAIIKGLQEILGKGTNITIGAGVDPNAGSQVKKQVQNVANAGQQAANKNKVKVTVDTKTEDAKRKLDAFYSRIKEQGTLQKASLELDFSKKNETELKWLQKQLSDVGEEARNLKTELGDLIPQGDYTKLSELERNVKNSTDRIRARIQGLKDSAISEINNGLNQAYTKYGKAQSSTGNTQSYNPFINVDTSAFNKVVSENDALRESFQKDIESIESIGTVTDTTKVKIEKMLSSGSESAREYGSALKYLRNLMDSQMFGNSSNSVSFTDPFASYTDKTTLATDNPALDSIYREWSSKYSDIFNYTQTLDLNNARVSDFNKLTACIEAQIAEEESMAKVQQEALALHSQITATIPSEVKTYDDLTQAVKAYYYAAGIDNIAGTTGASAISDQIAPYTLFDNAPKDITRSFNRLSGASGSEADIREMTNLLAGLRGIDIPKVENAVKPTAIQESLRLVQEGLDKLSQLTKGTAEYDAALGDVTQKWQESVALMKATEEAEKTATTEAEKRAFIQAKYGISQFNSEMTKYGKLSLDRMNLSFTDSNGKDFAAVDTLTEESRKNLDALKDYLADILPQDQLDEVLRRYDNFERELADKLYRARQHQENLQDIRNSTKATAEEKRQAKQTDDYTNDLATVRNKYKNMSDVPTDVSGALDNVDAQIKKLDTLKVGTEDYANQLKAIGTAWADATRQMSSFDEAQKKAENHVKSMTEQALKWKESIKDSDTASQELRDSIDGIIDASKKLDSDHSSDAYKKGVKDLDDAFISTKASMSVYTDGYKDLESTARRALTEIRKKELELDQAGNHSFDSILIGDSKTTSLDDSLESQLNSLKGMNTQSATYKQRVSEIVEEWLKVKLQIEQALRSEEDLEKEAEQKHGQVRSKQAAYNTIQNRLSSTEFTRKNSVALGRFNTGVLDDGKTGQQVLAELDAAMKQLDENKGPTEFKATLSQVDDLLVRVRKHIDDALVQSRQTKTANTDTDKIENLMRTLYQYKETLHGFEGSKFEAEYNELFDAIKNGSYSFEEAQMKVSKFQNACHQAGLETETLGQKLSRLFKEHFQTAIAMAGVAMVKQGLREVYDNVLELDTAVTELKKVSKMTGDEMNEYLDRTATNARELGANISDLVSSTADWKRLGYTDKDSEELARVSALMANVGDQIDDATTASSYLISTMQGFGLVADDAEHLLDCMNQIANTEPVSMNDLGIIMQKSSAAMSAAGNTYQETLSLAAAVNGVLQDSEASGTYLKTLSMYLRASKTDAENAGIATDGMASSVSELRSELKQLAGVDIMKDDNTFKSTYQIMKELSEVWKDLSDTTQANITELIAGKRGGQSTSALLNNFSVAEDAMKQALNSSGSAMRENQTYMDSLQAKLNQLDSAFQKFSTDLMKSDIPKFFVDLATVFVDGADNAVKFAGALPTLTAAISGVLSVMQMSGKLKNGAGKVNMPSYICCV